MKLVFFAFLWLCLCACSSEAREYRLANGNNTAGLLQSRTSSSTWGTVCGSFNEAAATVACSSIGLVGYVGAVVPTSLFGIGYGPITMSDVQCSSNLTSSLDSCEFNSSPTCSHASDVSISCALPHQAGMSFKLENGTFGFVMFRTSSASPWGILCYPSDYQIAYAACRSIDPYMYSRYNSRSQVSIPSGIQTTMLGQRCGSEANVTLDRCFATVGPPSQCSFGLSVSSCRRRSYQVKLVNRSDHLEGLVVVRPDVGYPWGTICNKNFTGFNPTVLCRMAGHPGTVGFVVPRPAAYAVESPSMPIYFSNMSCPSNTTSSTSDCEFSTDISGCSHSMDVYLRCSLPNTTVTSSMWQFQIGDSVTTSYIPLLVRPNASAPWGGVCYSNFNYASQNVACKTMGYPYSSASYSTTSRGATPLYMYNVQCDDNAHNLTQCFFDTSAEFECSSIITLRCRPRQASFQLTSGTLMVGSELGGVLEMLPNAAVGWGTVCQDGTFTAAMATEVCNTLSSGRVGQITSRYGGSFLNSSLYSKFNCTGVSSIYQCKTTVPTHPCPPVGIDCVIPTVQSTLEVSVDGEPTSSYRPLLMRPNSSAPWLPMCWMPLAVDTILAICTQLGYPTTSYGTSSTSSFYQGSNRIRLSSLSCATPTTPLSNCVSGTTESVSSSSCSSVQTIYCYRYGSDNYVLSGPSSTTGLLVSRLFGTTGTVCSLPAFAGHAPNVACKTVGLPGYAGALRFVGAGSGTISEAAISCPYMNTTSLTYCSRSFNTTSSLGCTHQSDVGLYCSIPTPTSDLQVMVNAQNVVLVRRTPNEAWGGVCYNTIYDKNAFGRAVCASIGRANFSAYLWYNYSEVEGVAVTMHEVTCANVFNLTNLAQCLYSSATPISGCSRLATVQCQELWEARLFEGPDEFSGRVAIRPSGYAPWGTACRKGATDAVATNLCTLAGLQGYQGKLTTIFGAGSGPVYMSNIKCPSEYDADSCTYNTTSANGCSGSDAIGIVCTKPPIRKNWEYALTSFGSSTRQALLVRPSSSSEWGYVAYGSAGFSTEAATVACRSVRPTTPTYASYSYSYMSSITVYLSDVTCPDGSTHLGECLANSTQWTPTSSVPVVTLACYYTSSQWDMRLAPASITSSSQILSGRIEVRPSPFVEWGTVCRTGQEDISHLCRLLHGSSAYGLVSQSTTRFGAGTGPIYMSSLNCPTSASRVGDCSFINQSSTTGCSHDNDLGIDCVIPPARSSWTYTATEGCTATSQYCSILAHKEGNTNTSYVCYYAQDSDPQYNYYTTSVAKMLCSSIGIPFAEVYSSYTTDSSSTQGRVALSCASNWTAVGSLQRCHQIPVQSCRNNRIVRVYCQRPVLSFKLQNTRNTSSAVVGTLLVMPHTVGEYGAVCAGGFDDKAATIACRSIGLHGMVGRVKEVVAASSTGHRTIVENVNCLNVESDPFAVLSECQFDAATSCTSAVVLECSLPPAQQWEVQHQWYPGEYNSVRLRPNASAPWGVLCFDTYYSDGAAATALCRSLPQYNNYTIGYFSSNYRQSYETLPTYAEFIDCPPNVTQLSRCTFMPSASGESTQCSYQASLMCAVSLHRFDFRLRTAAPNVANLGVVELRPQQLAFNASAWGTLCFDRSMPNDAANVLCGFLGFPTSEGAFAKCPSSTADHSFGMPIYARDVVCNNGYDCYGQPNDFDEWRDECTHKNDTCIYCPPPPTGHQPASSQWDITLQQAGSSYEQKLVYVRPNTSVAWGHICNGSTFGAREAKLICSLVGCSNCKAQWGTKPLWNGHGPVYMNQVRCSPTATNLQACSYWYYANGTSTCAQEDAVTVGCIPPYRPNVPPDVPYTTLATNRAGLILISSTYSMYDLQEAILEAFGIVVNVSVTTSEEGGATGGALAVLVMFPSSTDRNKVVDAVNDEDSAFAVQHDYVLAASTLSTSTAGAPPSGGSSDGDGGAIAGSVVGSIVFIVVVGAIAYNVFFKSKRRQEDKNEFQESMLNFVPGTHPQAGPSASYVPQPQGSYSPPMNPQCSGPQIQPLGGQQAPGHFASPPTVQQSTVTGNNTLERKRSSSSSSSSSSVSLQGDIVL